MIAVLGSAQRVWGVQAMFYLLAGICAGLVVGLAVEWAVDWSGLRLGSDRRERSALGAVRQESELPQEPGDEQPSAES